MTSTIACVINAYQTKTATQKHGLLRKRGLLWLIHHTCIALRKIVALPFWASWTMIYAWVWWALAQKSDPELQSFHWFHHCLHHHSLRCHCRFSHVFSSHPVQTKQHGSCKPHPLFSYQTFQLQTEPFCWDHAFDRIVKGFPGLDLTCCLLLM